MQTNVRKTTVVDSNIKFSCILLSWFLFITYCPILYTQEIPTVLPQHEDKELELNFEELLTAIIQANTLITSGEGEVIYTYGHPPFDKYTETVKGNITFDLSNTRFDLPRSSTILTPTAKWEISNNRNGNSRYYFSQKPNQNIQPMNFDPRNWLNLGTHNQDIESYLRENQFDINKIEFFHDVQCYVLETKKGENSTKLWISSEQGFRCLKRENIYLLPVDALDSDIPMDALAITRTIIRYQQFGEVWFPKRIIHESSWVDIKPNEPIFFRQTLETKNFKINHLVSTNKFSPNIHENASIRVEGSNKVYSKTEFIEQYGDK